jgi:hypothetical protein
VHLLGTQKYRQANKVDLGMLIAQNQLIGDTLSKSEPAFNEKKMPVQTSKFWLINALFSEIILRMWL